MGKIYNLRRVESEIISVSSHCEINPSFANILFITFFTCFLSFVLGLEEADTPTIWSPIIGVAKLNTVFEDFVITEKLTNFFFGNCPRKTS